MPVVPSRVENGAAISPTMGFSCFCIECVDTATLGILESFGQFKRILKPVRGPSLVKHRKIGTAGAEH